MSKLTDDQLKRIEENRKRALQLKSIKGSSSSAPSLSSSNSIYPKPICSKKGTLCKSAVSLKHGERQQPTTSQVLSCSLVEDNKFSVTCKYNPEIIKIFKSISSRKYDPTTKNWTFDLADHINLADKLRAIGQQLSSMDNAVLVKNFEGSTAAVPLNYERNEDKTCKALCYLVCQDRFEVDMPFHASCVAHFKTVPSKFYNITTRRWSFSLKDYKKLYEKLRKEPGVLVEPLSSTVLNVFKEEIAGKRCSSEIPECDLTKLDEDFYSALMPFQKEGVNFAVARNGRILLADDMGLGKTIQSICIASYYKERWPLLVVCPSSVRLMWKESFLRWLPSHLVEDDISVILSSGNADSNNNQVVIISYDLLTKHQNTYANKKFQFVILDESHFIKNSKTARSRAATAVLKHAKHILLLSGTPALSRPCELYPQLFVLRPDLFPRFHHFGLRYCSAKKNPWGWEYTGSSNADELRLVLQKTVMLRRTKNDVLSQLPSKLRRSVSIDVSSFKTSVKLKEALESAHHAVEKKGLSGVEKHGALLSYFNETAHVKLPAIKSYVFDLLEGGHKFLLFAHHKMVLDHLEKDLEKKGYEYMRIDGNTPSEKRQSEVARFQEKSACKVALLSITAANMGITLHSASLVIFAELFWNPGILVQAEDRCYRIGQQNIVNVHYLVAKGTADDYIWEMVKKKLDVLGKVGLSGSNFDDTENHTAEKKEKTIAQYFQSESIRKTDHCREEECNDEVHDMSDCSVSDQDLLQALQLEQELFQHPCSSAADDNDRSSCSTSTALKHHSSHTRHFTEDLLRSSDEEDYELDLKDVTSWKRKRKRSSEFDSS